MDFFIHGVFVQLLSFLTIGTCQFLPSYPQLLTSSGCVRYQNESECVYNVYCSEYFDENTDPYVIRPRNMYRPDDLYGNRDCVNTIRNGHMEYKPIYLTYKDPQPSGFSIPESRNNYYNQISVFSLIVRLDISNNAYVAVPDLKVMNNLVFLNVSNNAITAARLCNIQDLPALNEIDFSHNTINTIQIDPMQHVYSQLNKLNLSHNYMVELPDSVFEKFPLLEILDLSYNYIDTISIAAFEGIKRLNSLLISHNRITDVNRAFFRFTELKHLDLSHNHIEIVKMYDFEKLVKLETIDLSANLIVSIEGCTFCGMHFLESINLRDNKLSSMNKETFSNASNLHTIDISNNNFYVLPRGLFKGKNVQVFSINGNNLRDSLPQGTFEGLLLVTKLDLSYQYLTKIEDYAFLGLDSVKTLLLNNNKIHTLSKNCFRTLKNLITLDLSSNNITDLNFDVEDLGMLNTIVLKDNFLTQIRQEHFHGLNMLKLLDLTNNKISNFMSNSFSSLSYLENFKISNNPLNGTLAKKTFDGLSSLPSLIVSFTELTTIENGSFSGMTNLKLLNMSHSKISDLQYNAFLQTGAIELMDLSYNQLRTFNVNATNIAHVDVLLLNNNLLKVITESTFDGLAYLTKINLAHNNIKNTYIDAFSKQKDLQYLDLSYNIEMNFDVSYISKNKDLVTLSLSGVRNGIKFNNIEDPRLANLEISYSGLTNVTEVNLKKMIRLENLVLRNNEIDKLEVGAFTNLSKLTHLDISGNKIYYIQPGVFKDNVNLDSLNISYNSLTTISYGIFRGLIYLNTLDISYNSINSLETERFYEVQSLRRLIVDHNKIDSINVEDFAGTNLEILSIGENPLSCELLVNFKKHSPRFAITAIKLNEHIGENIDGVTCNMNGYVYKKNANDTSPKSSDNLLIDIKELLAKIANKNTDNQKPVFENDTLQHIKNITDHVDKITDKYENDWSALSNSTALLTEQSNKTNVLLAKILHAISKSPPGITTPFPVLKDNVTNDLVIYINKMKEELEKTIAAEKELILNEVEKKVAILKSKDRMNISTSEMTSTESSNIALHDKLSAKNESNINVQTSLFTETCVGLILAILVCFILYKFYKSRMFVRASRSYSTRELPEAMESPHL